MNTGSKSQAWHKQNNRLRNRIKPVLWSGTVGPEDALQGGEPPQCADVPCDRFDLDIQLPPGTFNNPFRPGGVQIAVRWESEFDALNVFVYKDDELVGSSAGIIATAQSLLLEAPENGRYTVWIAPDPSYNIHPSVDYEAVAEVELSPMTKPVRRLLPDLEFRPTRTVTFQTPSFPFFEPDPPPGASCYTSEMEEEGAQNCLRFDQVIANVGRAPLELRFGIPRDPDDTSNNVFQRVYSSDGSFEDQPAGHWEFHGIHDHFHYTSFAFARLWQSDASGRRIGESPVRTSEKVSFCIVDIEIDRWAEKGDGPRTYFAPDCLFPTASDENSDYLVQGVTNGWSDVYDWYLPDQYIEVTGVPDGYYQLESCADPDGTIEEVDETNNCHADLIKLTNMGTADQQAENLGPVD